MTIYLNFITTQPLHFNTHRKFNYQFYEKNDINVKIIDLSKCYFAEENLLKLDEKHQNYNIKLPEKNEISNFSSFDKLTKNKTNNFYFIVNKSIYNEMEGEKEIFEILNANNAKYFFQTSLYQGLYQLKNYSYFWLKKSVKLKYKSYFRNLINPEFVFGSGSSICSDSNVYFRNNVEVLSTKSLWIDDTEPSISTSGSFGVFIEEAVLGSPDTLLLDRKPLLQTQSEHSRYFNYINSIFNQIEIMSGIKIIISASGKYFYSEQFGDRAIFYGETLNLIKKASFVIMHNSISFLQAVYNLKPILLLDYDFNNKYKRNDIYALEKFLACQRLNFNGDLNKINLNNLLKLSAKSEIKYKNIIKKYLEEKNDVLPLNKLLFKKLNEEY